MVEMRHCRIDRVGGFFFQVGVVHHGRTVFNGSEAVGNTGCVKHCFGENGLSRPAVS